MNLREEVLREHSRKQCDVIVNWVGQSQKRFNELFQLFMADEKLVAQRAAWPVSYCIESFPDLLNNHFEQLVKKLAQPGIHDGVKRNSMRMLQHVKIPEQWEGALMNFCFDYLSSPTEAVAIKAFSITVLGKLAKKYPEIIPELQLVIEDQLPVQTAAFKSRAQQLRKDLTINQ